MPFRVQAVKRQYQKIIKQLMSAALLLGGLGFATPVLSGPQVHLPEMDFQMLDLNGTPFRFFHLQRYSKVLARDNISLNKTASETPSQSLSPLDAMRPLAGVHSYEIHLSAPTQAVTNRALGEVDFESLRNDRR